jgi:hypothetical protein
MQMENWKTVILAFLVLPISFHSRANAAQNGLVAWWKFDDGTTAAALDTVTAKTDPITGFFKYVDGVTGRALMFDGYATCVTRSADKAPQLTDAFTIEAWVAMQTLPWNWTAIVDQQGKTHLFFGIDAGGHLGMKLNIDGQLHECVTKEKLPLLKWSHVAATFSQQDGIILYHPLHERPRGRTPASQRHFEHGRLNGFVHRQESRENVTCGYRARRKPKDTLQYGSRRPA